MYFCIFRSQDFIRRFLLTNLTFGFRRPFRVIPRRLSPYDRPMKFTPPVPLCLTRRFRHFQGEFQPSGRPQYPWQLGKRQVGVPTVNLRTVAAAPSS
jgi:hypothetical protein